MGTELAFDEFYTATSKRVTVQVYVMVGNLAEAEDAVADAYARAWQRWARLSDYADPEAWVRTVAFRIAVSAWRRALNRVTAQRRYAAAEELPDLSPDRLALVAALRRINPGQRQAVVLHYLVGLSVNEIADEVGVPVSTVKTRLRRGRMALAAYASEFADDSSPAPSTRRPALEVTSNV